MVVVLSCYLERCIWTVYDDDCAPDFSWLVKIVLWAVFLFHDVSTSKHKKCITKTVMYISIKSLQLRYEKPGQDILLRLVDATIIFFLSWNLNHYIESTITKRIVVYLIHYMRQTGKLIFLMFCKVIYVLCGGLLYTSHMTQKSCIMVINSTRKL